jgi:hypothetical protein
MAPDLLENLTLPLNQTGDIGANGSRITYHIPRATHLPYFLDILLLAHLFDV